MALPTLDSVFASAADQPRRYMLSQWLVNELGSGSVADYITLPERYLWAKIAVAAGAPKDEAFYINAPKQYAWKDIYDAVSGSSLGTIDWGEKQALGHIAAAYRGDTGNPANLATYIDWPWRYQIASVIDFFRPDPDTLAFITASGATDIQAIDGFVKGVKALGLWDSMVAWPLRSSQNAGTGTTAYSLGGLGTFNGTLTNGPTWGTDGITFDGSNDYIITPLEANDYPNGLSELVVFNAPTNTANFSMFFGDEFGADGSHAAMIRRQGSSNGVETRTDFTGSVFGVTASQSMTFGQWNLVHSRVVAPTVFISVNAAVEASATSTGTFSPTNSGGDRVGFGARNKASTPAFFATMTAAFGAFWGSGTSASQMQSVKDLYKTTLGLGLNLP
jgi:hypothetical protein